MKVFVYGTLKRNYGNNYILEGARFLGEASTIAKCRLFNAGFPVLRPRTERQGEWNAPVSGEVWEIDPAVHLARLDRLESEGRMYNRRIKLVRLLASGKVIKAHAYVGSGHYWQRRLRLYPLQAGQYVWPV